MYKHDVKYKAFWQSKDLNVLKEKIVDPKLWDKEIDAYMQLLTPGAPIKGTTILEIGCGIGRLMKPMSELASKVIGLDISPDMKREGEAYLAGNQKTEIRLVNADYSWPVDDASVDYCYSVIVFQHIPSIDIIRKYLSELKRVLKPGGVFKIQTHKGSAASTNGFHGFHGHYFSTLDSFVKEFTDAGLQIDIKAEGLGYKDWLWVMGTKQ